MRGFGSDEVPLSLSEGEWVVRVVVEVMVVMVVEQSGASHHLLQLPASQSGHWERLLEETRIPEELGWPGNDERGDADVQ